MEYAKNRFYLLYEVFNSLKLNHCNSLCYIYPDFCLQTYARPAGDPWEGGEETFTESSVYIQAPWLKRFWI